MTAPRRTQARHDLLRAIVDGKVWRNGGLKITSFPFPKNAVYRTDIGRVVQTGEVKALAAGGLIQNHGKPFVLTAAGRALLAEWDAANTTEHQDEEDR